MINIYFLKFIYLFLAALGLHFCARAFSSCGERGPLFIVVHGPLTIAASLVAEHRLQTRRLSNCGSRAQLLRGMWDPPRPGLEPVSPALAGRLSTTAPPGKPLSFFKVLSNVTKHQTKGLETAVCLNLHLVLPPTHCNSIKFMRHYGPGFKAVELHCSGDWDNRAGKKKW